MKTIYYIGASEYDNEEAARQAAIRNGPRRNVTLSQINWAEFDDAGNRIAEGGICVDPKCVCEKRWTHWRKESTPQK